MVNPGRISRLRDTGRPGTATDATWCGDGMAIAAACVVSIQDEKSRDFGRSEFGNPQKVMGNPHEIRCFGGSGRLCDMAARQLCPVAMAPKWVCWQGWWVWPENHLLSLLLVYDISTVYMYLCIYIYTYVYIHMCMYINIYIYTCLARRQDFPVDETPSHVTYSARHKVAGGSQVSVRLRLTRAEMSRSLRAKDVMEIKIRHDSPDRKFSDFHWITLNIPKFWQTLSLFFRNREGFEKSAFADFGHLLQHRREDCDRWHNIAFFPSRASCIWWVFTWSCYDAFKTW